jgi:hypothetical protein
VGTFFDVEMLLLEFLCTNYALVTAKFSLSSPIFSLKQFMLHGNQPRSSSSRLGEGKAIVRDSLDDLKELSILQFLIPFLNVSFRIYFLLK